MPSRTHGVTSAGVPSVGALWLISSFSSYVCSLEIRLSPFGLKSGRKVNESHFRVWPRAFRKDYCMISCGHSAHILWEPAVPQLKDGHTHSPCLPVGEWGESWSGAHHLPQILWLHHEPSACTWASYSSSPVSSSCKWDHFLSFPLMLFLAVKLPTSNHCIFFLELHCYCLVSLPSCCS